MTNCDNNKKKKRGPAPKLPEQKQLNRINVYLTDDELYELKRRAAGLKLPKYLRDLGLSREAPIINIPEGNYALADELRRLGSNLNQIARQLNAVQTFDSSELKALADEIRATHAALLGGAQ